MSHSTPILFFVLFLCAMGFSIPSQAQLELIYDKGALSPAMQSVQGDAYVTDIVDQINQDYTFTSQVTLRFVAYTDDDGPYYDPQTRMIMVPHAFVDYVSDRWIKEGLQGDDVRWATQAVVAHTLLHESAHALIDVLQLPVTGVEENVADEFATFMLVDMYEQGAQMALDAAEFFFIEGGELTHITDEDVFADHALDDQRFYHIACFAYGLSDDQATLDVLKAIALSDQQMRVCVEDAARRMNAWQYMRENF